MTSKIGAELFGANLLTKEGLKPPQEVLANTKRIAIYFSAHWCPPCRGFTPVLSEFYSTMSTQRNDVEIVFVSSDRDESSFNEYFGSMPWVALPFNERTLKQTLAEKFGVRGIPFLVVIDENGDIVDEAARTTVTSAQEAKDVASALKKWNL